MPAAPLVNDPTPWSADWANVGLGDYGLSAYKGPHDYGHVTHDERITFVDDPVLGAARTVMKMSPFNTDTEAGGHPRSQADSPRILLDGQTFWFGTGTYLPEDFPIIPAGDANNFLTFCEFTGPPVGDPYPFRFTIRDDPSDTFLIQHHNHMVGVTDIWERPIVRGQWLDLAFQFRLSRVPSWGFIRFWINTGNGWESQPLNGGGPTYRMATLGTANWQGPNAAQVKVYRYTDMLVGGDDPVTAYFAGHAVGNSLAAVDPHSYG